MTGFRRRTGALVHTVLVNAGLVPIPLFINAPDPQGAFAATLPLVKYVEFIIQGGRTGRQGKLQPPAVIFYMRGSCRKKSRFLT